MVVSSVCCFFHKPGQMTAPVCLFPVVVAILDPSLANYLKHETHLWNMELDSILRHCYLFHFVSTITCLLLSPYFVLLSHMAHRSEPKKLQDAYMQKASPFQCGFLSAGKICRFEPFESVECHWNCKAQFSSPAGPIPGPHSGRNKSEGFIPCNSRGANSDAGDSWKADQHGETVIRENPLLKPALLFHHQ